jgi:uncharacterized membrane protein HdeD (DUF308 family)
VTDATRVLLTAAILAVTAVGAYAVRLAQAETDSHDHLVGQLRLSSVMAILLAALGAIDVGLAIASRSLPSAGLDVAIGCAFVVAAAFALSRAPREGLFLMACAFLAHALSAIAHRPGLLAEEIAPRWYLSGSAACDLYLATVCYWVRRR